MRRVRPFRPASACSFPSLRLNLVLTRGIPPDFRGGVHYFFEPPYAIGPVPSLSDRTIAYRWRPLQRVSWHGASRPQVVPVAGGPIKVRLSFPMYICVCMYGHIHTARVWINRVRLPILHVVSGTGKIDISLSAFAPPENLVSRGRFGSPVPRQPACSSPYITD